ncbi:MAG: porphobilinogen synthase [Candidatus Eremiobacteraeota bacterium]|nr:porphobilinogen synthase [Candidatus Eremiobacteraeota bacterium]
MSIRELLRPRTTVDLRKRPRRLRANAALRELVRENVVRVASLVQPLFVADEGQIRGEIASMPGIFRYSVDDAASECVELWALGVRAVLLFGIPDFKDAVASSAHDAQGVVQRAIGAIKRAVPEMLVIADVCNCEYTDHGHCGIIDERGDVDNDATLELLAKTALSYARAGVDIVAPSDMMDGRTGYLRAALDEAGYAGLPIMAYAVKFASAFYGPFRDAADSTPQFGDRRTYQMDPANGREALREASLDLDEGADFLIVKPALAYMDLIAAVREISDVPVVCYNVSGEYSMVKAAALNGWIDEDRVVDETLLGFARAGADIIITYFAKSYARRHTRG